MNRGNLETGVRQVTVGASRSQDDLGVRVFDDLPIVGYDDLAVVAHSPAPLYGL